MKLLNGDELASYIKERQAQQVRHLQAEGQVPCLAIFYDNEDPVIMKYVELKKIYGEDIGVKVLVQKLPEDEEEARKILKKAQSDREVHGVIVQLPLKHLDLQILEEISPEKDVDGLNNGMFSATAEAINWLLGGYGIDLSNKRIAIVGRGKLVGAPLEKMWKDSEYDVEVFEKGDNLENLKDFDLVVSATGVAGLIKPQMLAPSAIVIDAGTASEDGVIKGDLDEAIYREREDLTITPKIGGVGPLTITLLFEHTLRAAAELEKK